MSEITLETTGLQQSRQYLFENAILTTVSNLYNRIGIAELSAPIPETQCCFLKIADLLALSQPQNAVQASHPPDLLIIASTITPEFAPTLTRLYEQMTTPKFVITLGACSATSSSTNWDIETLIPVNVHLSECPLRSQTVLNAIAQLQPYS